MFIKPLLLFALIAGLVAVPVPSRSSERRVEFSAGTRKRDPGREFFSSVPLQFEPNQGQADSGFDFVARGVGYDTLISAGEAVFVFKQKQRGNYLKQRRLDASVHQLSLRLLATRPGVRASGEERLS